MNAGLQQPSSRQTPQREVACLSLPTPKLYIAVSLCCCFLTSCWRSSTSTESEENANRTSIERPTDLRPNSAIASNRSSHDKGRKVFHASAPFKLKIELNEQSKDRMLAEHRPYERGVLIEEKGDRFASVGFKLKGAAGSYQDFNGKPGFTVKMDKFRKKQSFHGVDKFHLNNAVQDETYVNEWLGTAVFDAFDYPAPRVHHAVIELNDAPKSLYVLREAYDVDFVERWFGSRKGNLYDGGFLQDLDAELQKDCGEGVDDHSDLKRIVEAIHLEDSAARWKALEQLIDVDAFLTFMAIERFICHWDGYSNNANNYRLHFDRKTGKAVFLPHGMDQIFGELGMGMFDFGSAMLSREVIASDAMRMRFRERVRSILARLGTLDPLIEKLNKRSDMVHAALSEFDPDEANLHRDRIEDLKNRIRERVRIVAEQLEQPDTTPESIEIGAARSLTDWNPGTDGEHIRADSVSTDQGEQLRIAVSEGTPGFGAWYSSLLLPRGRYGFRGKYRVEDVKPIEEAGAETLVLHHKDEHWLQANDDGEWHEWEETFEVHEDRMQIEFFIGLRASKGMLVLDKDSLRVTREP